MSVKFRHRGLGVRAPDEVVACLEAPSSRSRTLVSGGAGRMLQRERPTGVACSACLSRSVTARTEKLGYVLQVEIFRLGLIYSSRSVTGGGEITG